MIIKTSYIIISKSHMIFIYFLRSCVNFNAGKNVFSLFFLYEYLLNLIASKEKRLSSVYKRWKGWQMKKRTKATKTFNRFYRGDASHSSCSRQSLVTTLSVVIRFRNYFCLQLQAFNHLCSSKISFCLSLDDICQIKQMRV